MKRSLATVLGLLTISLSAPAFANGPGSRGPNHGPDRHGPVYQADSGTLFITNNSGVAQRVTIDHMNLGLLRAGASKVVTLDVGRHNVSMTAAGRFGLTKTEVVRISPLERETLRIRPAAASLRVRNPYRFAVQLEVDGQKVGMIAPGGVMTVTGLELGRANVELLRGRQVVSQESLRLTRGVNGWLPSRYAVTSPGFEIAFR